nr:DNA/RNA non-specific endonuclease [Rhodococcus qingshengii]
MTLRRSVAGVLAAGAVLTGTAGVIGAGIALSAGPAAAGPAEDCAAVRARDHQIYLNLIASLPPGAPIPPEYINPCLTAPSTTATAAPTTTVGLPGAQAPGGGPNVGANAPTNFPTYNGTPIVPVPGAALPGTPGAPTTSGVENPAGVPVPSTTSGLAPTTTQPAGSTAPTATTDRGPGPIPAATPNSVPGQPESTPSVTTSGLDEDDGRDRYLELVLVGAAAFTAGGIGVRGCRSPFGPRTPLNGRTPLSGRTPESVLSHVVGTLASPLMQYSKGGFEQITIPNGDGGDRTLVLINDPTSPHTYRFPQQVPPGGRMLENPDGSVSILDADGNTVSTIDAPWAYDAAGRPVRTGYEVDGDTIVQKIYPAADSIYPIVADPNRTVEADGSVTDTYEDGWINVKDNGDGTSTVSTPDGQPYLIATQGGQASDVGLDMSSDGTGSEPTSGLDQAQGVAPGSADDDPTTGDYGNNGGGNNDYDYGGGGGGDGGGEDGQWSGLDQAQGTAPGSATVGPVSTTESDGSTTLTYPDGSWINTRINPDGSQTVSYPDAPPEVIFPGGQRASTTYNGTTATTTLYGADNSLDERLTTYQVGTPDESWVHVVYDDDGGHTVYYPDSTPDHFGADGTRTEIINGDVVTFNTDGTVADVESVEAKATRDWLGEITSTLVAVSTFSQNIRGANGIAGLTDAGGDILDAGKTVAGAAVAYNQDPTGTTAQTLASLARLDALEQYGPQYWIRQLQHDAALAVLTGPFGEAAAATRVTTSAGRIEAGVARSGATSGTRVESVVTSRAQQLVEDAVTGPRWSRPPANIEQFVTETAGTKGNWNNTLNNPQPNTRYIVDNRYIYDTDAAGRVVNAEGFLDRLTTSDRSKGRQRNAGKPDRLPGDEGGHTFAAMFHSPGEAINLTAMRADLNRIGLREFGKIEDEWAKILKQGGTVQPRVSIQYPGDSLRPSVYAIEWHDLSGKLRSVRLRN